MNVVVFYEKPGCATNFRQKKLLRESGCFVIERNLLQHGFSAEELRAFLEPLPVPAWFNPNAPAVKKGLVKPMEMNEREALAALLCDPILIRRPLIACKGDRLCGFDIEVLEKILGERLDVDVKENCSSQAGGCTSR